MKTNQTREFLCRLQRNELTWCEIYRRMARRESNVKLRTLLMRLAADEERHCAMIARRTEKDCGVDPLKLRLHLWLSRFAGSTFVIRQMESCEAKAAAEYATLAEDDPLRTIARDEEHHRKLLEQTAEQQPLSYISSVVLGLNDALVEFTGALSGFTLALGDARLVALAGGITGIAAALSMASSEYLATRTGRNREKHPLRAAAYTGISYIVTVAILIMPYLLINSLIEALAVMLVAALGVIALFNYYYAVVRCESFIRRFMEMALLSFGIAAISFTFGYILRVCAGV